MPSCICMHMQISTGVLEVHMDLSLWQYPHKTPFVERVVLILYGAWYDSDTVYFAV